MLSKTLLAIQLLSETQNKPPNVSFKNKTTTAFAQDYENRDEIGRILEQIAQKSETRPTLFRVINPTSIGLKNPAVLAIALQIPMTTDALRGATSNMLTWNPA